MARKREVDDDTPSRNNMDAVIGKYNDHAVIISFKAKILLKSDSF